MSADTSSNRAILRTLVIVALSVLLVAIFAMDLRRLWFPIGINGYQTNADGTVLVVDDESPAAKAGMEVGDRVDVSSTPPQFRPYVVQGTFVWSGGQSITFGLVHRGAHRTITLMAAPQRLGSLSKAFQVLRFVAALLFVSVGAALALLRPSRMTGGFFFYCLAFSPGSWLSAWALPAPGAYITDNLFNLIQVAGLIGLLIFALSFLADPMSRWRVFGYRLMPWLFVALFVLWTWTFYQITWTGGPPAEILFRTTLALVMLMSFLALCILIDTYVRARGTDRQRMRWIIVGLGASLTAFSLFWTLVFYSPNTPIWIIDTLQITSVVVPLTFGYAVIKHRVVDVSFVVSRALVYGVLTTLLVGAFSVVDWVFIEKLKLARLGTIAEMGMAVAAGIWFNGLHKRVDAFIDATFFRQRHNAERQLARNAAALPFASTAKAVAQALVSEPVRTLSLASAALFRRAKDGVFVRELSEGWSVGDLTRLDDDDDRFLALVQAEGGVLTLYEHPWRSTCIPPGPARPVLALPIIVRRELMAITFYGSHVHGEALDPDEIRAIASLAPAAAAAYDHLEAEAMKREVEVQKSKIEVLEARLAETQIQPA